MSHRVLIALGSNHQPAAHIQWASQRILWMLERNGGTDTGSTPRLSRRLWTTDIHGTGPHYLNRLILCDVGEARTANEIEAALKAIEAETRRAPGRVTIDLDLMQYDEERYHLRDWPRPYIQQLLPDLQ